MSARQSPTTVMSLQLVQMNEGPILASATVDLWEMALIATTVTQVRIIM